MTPARAVLIGHMWINVPVIGMVVIGALLATFLGAPPPLGGFAGIVLGWLWWSLMVPRWRAWALRRNVDAAALQRLGERTFLLWKQGSMLERTEFRDRAKKE
jgi:hypothetical protein